MELDHTRELLAGLGLHFAAESLGEELSEAVKHNRAKLAWNVAVMMIG